MQNPNKTVTIEGINITLNPLTGTWFIFAKTAKDGKDATISGTLAEMKKCARFAGKNKTIVQV